MMAQMENLPGLLCIWVNSGRQKPTLVSILGSWYVNFHVVLISLDPGASHRRLLKLLHHALQILTKENSMLIYTIKVCC